MKFLEEEITAFQVAVKTPHEAIQKAGDLLVKQGYVDAHYTEAMIHSFNEHGPYIVIAPGIALPHARPEDGVNEASVSFVQLAEPIAFGNQANDPVSLVFGLGASSSEEHLEILKMLMNVLREEGTIEKLKQANTYEEIKPYLNGGEQ